MFFGSEKLRSKVPVASSFLHPNLRGKPPLRHSPIRQSTRLETTNTPPIRPRILRKRQKKKRRHEELPEHLPRFKVEAAVSDEQKHCPEHGERKVIGYHLPVYRQQDQFAGSGSRAESLAVIECSGLNVLKASAFVLRPLCEHVKQTVLATDILV